MNTPVLTIDELHNIEAGAWFSKLSQTLKSAILARAVVRRLADGDALASRGSTAQEWCGVARGAVRISSVSLSGKQVTLTYAEPGTWFGDIALFDGLPRTHDADAHGATTLVVVRKPDFKELLAQHVELYDALLRLNCRRLRLMFNQFEDLNTRPLQARLAKQILLLARSYGIQRGDEIIAHVPLSLALSRELIAFAEGRDLHANCYIGDRLLVTRERPEMAHYVALVPMITVAIAPTLAADRDGPFTKIDPGLARGRADSGGPGGVGGTRRRGRVLQSAPDAQNPTNVLSFFRESRGWGRSALRTSLLVAADPKSVPGGGYSYAAIDALNRIFQACPLYTSDAADERSSGDLGGRRIIKKKKPATDFG